METPFIVVPGSHRNPQDQQAEHLKSSLAEAKKRLEKSQQDMDILSTEEKTILSRPFIQKKNEGAPLDPSTIPQNEKKHLYRLKTIKNDLLDASIALQDSEGEVSDFESELEEKTSTPSSPSEDVEQPHSN